MEEKGCARLRDLERTWEILTVDRHSVFDFENVLNGVPICPRDRMCVGLTGSDRILGDAWVMMEDDDGDDDDDAAAAGDAMCVPDIYVLYTLAAQGAQREGYIQYGDTEDSQVWDWE